MKRLFLAMMLFTVVPFTGAEARWYVSHLGPETCLRIEDIGNDLGRVYYGTGSMKVPEDFAAQVQRSGFARMRRLNEHNDLNKALYKFNKAGIVVAYQAIFLGHEQTPIDFVFFSDRDICQRFMASLEP